MAEENKLTIYQRIQEATKAFKTKISRIELKKGEQK